VAAGKVLAMVRSGLQALKHLAIDPDSADPSVVVILALTPSIVAGILFFRLLAVEMLAIGVGVALGAYAASRFRNEPLTTVPLLPALVGVALVGPGASPAWVVAVALVAVGLELARDRYTPGARLQVGLVAYALVWLASRGATGAYVNPGSTTPMAEPIRFWLGYFSGGQAPIDPVRLYVGNVAGPVFATSVLAVALGTSWLWYSRRLSLLVVLTFLVGVMVPIVMAGWSSGYQLLSGPLWFGAALVLADRRDLPRSPIGRPLVGLAAGVSAMWLRSRGFAIESTLAAMAAVQIAVVGVQGATWLGRNQRQVRVRLQELRSAAEVKPALPAGPS
jgi:Na+-translocating ferredoxin:NAD+ oxidoreductase subunit D